MSRHPAPLPSLLALPSLREVVGGQLAGVMRWADLPAATAARTQCLFDLFTQSAMDGPAQGPFGGLSRINASGLPFQWSFSFGADGGRSVRFLCEAGQPGSTPQARLALSLDLLKQASTHQGMSHPAWLWDGVLAHALPPPDAWPSAWRSALWFGVGASQQGVLIKPYLNLNRGTPLERWRRLGWILKDLGRESALERLCALSRQVSADSWPVGLALDLCPDGATGRIKIYFRAAAVTPDWLHRWYQATGSASEAPFVRQLLDAFAYCAPARSARYPERAMIVSLECHGRQDAMTLKTDLAITRWMHNDAAIASGLQRQLRGIGADPGELASALGSIGAWPPDPGAMPCLRFVGLGHEPDGTRHTNLYVEPPLPAPASSPSHPSVPVPKTSAATRAARPAHASLDAIAHGLDFLLSRIEDKHWRDYSLPVGTSDQWATAYALWQLSHLPKTLTTAEAGRQLAQAGDWLLRTHHQGGGWSYNADTDSDADSTSIALLALRARHRHAAMPPQARHFIAQCRCADGGTATYPAHAQPGGSWAMANTEITAVALLALGRRQNRAQRQAALDFLRARQLPDGTWPSFWWHSPLYATHAALCALTDFGSHPHTGNMAATLATTLATYQPIGAFESALLLSCCHKLQLHTRCAPLAQDLIAQQQGDGSWLPSAWLRLTDTATDAPHQTINAGPSFLDHNGIFTTATVLAALSQLQQHHQYQ